MKKLAISRIAIIAEVIATSSLIERRLYQSNFQYDGGYDTASLFYFSVADPENDSSRKPYGHLVWFFGNRSDIN